MSRDWKTWSEPLIVVIEGFHHLERKYEGIFIVFSIVRGKIMIENLAFILTCLSRLMPW